MGKILTNTGLTMTMETTEWYENVTIFIFSVSMPSHSRVAISISISIPVPGESVALLVARRTNNQPTIGRLRVRGLLKQCVSQC